MKRIAKRWLGAVVFGGFFATASLASAQSTTNGPTAVNPNVRVMPPGKSPAHASAGAVATPQSGNYPGTGSSVKHAASTATPTPAPGQSPAQGSAGAVATPPNGNYPGTGSGQQ